MCRQDLARTIALPTIQFSFEDSGTSVFTGKFNGPGLGAPAALPSGVPLTPLTAGDRNLGTTTRSALGSNRKR